MKDNPYVGPRPYERNDRHNFYGRDREARELRALAEMRVRLERLRELSSEFGSVELSPYVRGLLGRPRAAVAEPARRAAGI